MTHTLIFCDCGSLLDPPTSTSHVVCDVCSKTTNANVFETINSTTTSRPGLFSERPSTNLKKILKKAQDDKGATIDEKCPKCDASELVFHTAQLRSADEGQTVFYRCVKCGYKYSVNS